MARAASSSFLVGDSRARAAWVLPAAVPGASTAGDAEYPARSTALQISSSVSAVSS